MGLTEHGPQIRGKLRGEYLRGIIARNSQEPVTVLIELALPDPVVRTREAVRGGGKTRVPAAVAGLSWAQGRKNKRLIAEGRRLLSGRVVKPANWLESAGAFVATATPQRLLEIAASPVVRAIWPSEKATKSYAS